MPLNFVAKAAIQVGIMAASMALNMTRKIEGPRLDSLKFTSGDYGAALQMLWGKRRVEAPIFWAEDLKEVKQQRKTKGGKYNDYTYYGTWAVALAGHEVSGVTRIWLDTHLAFDLTGAGPITAFDFGARSVGKSSGGTAGAGGFSINEHMAIYYGTEDQEPDPRMMATVEAEFGEGSCPAYRGTAYIIFKDLPLEKLGNRIPQVSVEVVSNPSPASVVEDFETTIGTNLFRTMRFSPDFSRMAWVKEDEFEIWDVAARTQMLSGTISNGAPASATMIGVYNDGSILVPVTNGDDLIKYSPDGNFVETVYSGFDGQQYGVTVVQDGNGNEHWGTYAHSFGGRWYFDGVSYFDEWRARFIFADAYGDIWAVGGPAAGGTTVYFRRMVACGESPFTSDLLTISGINSADESYAVHVLTETEDFFALRHGNSFHKIDPSDGAVSGTVVATGNASVYAKAVTWANIPPGSSTIWLGDQEFSLIDFTMIRDLGVYAALPQSLYDPISHALVTDVMGGGVEGTDLRWIYIDRIAGDGVTLATIAADVADMVGVEDYSFSALDQIVKGWSATQGQASNMLEPLLDAYDSDIRPHDFEIQGVKRTGVSTGTILTERFVANDPRYSVKVRQAAELPRAITVTFADINADQQPNTARADRPLDATGAKGEQAIDMGTWAADADEGYQKTTRVHRRIWNERKEVSNSLTAQHLALEPADVKTLDLDGESDIYRLVRLTVKANGELATEWKYDHPSLAVIDGTTGANFDGRNPSVIVIAGIAKGFVLDIPLIRDVDSTANPIVYIAAAPYSSSLSFPGATAFQEVAGDYTEQLAGISSTAPATWGFATEVLSDANPNVWDRGVAINVKIQNGTLTGCTEAEIDANPFKNLALWGDEIINFTTATLQGDGSYNISGRKRGRRGTEWACAGHAVRDVFLLLNTAETEEMGLSEVATDLSFKVVTNGRNLESASPIEMEPFTGASLKPYAPCHLEAELDSGDWVMSWVRRTRVGGAWTGGSAVPLSEASEEYEVDIIDGEGTILRTLTGLASPTATWTAAMQTADRGAAAPVCRFVAYQVSDAVGRGFGAEGSSVPPTSTEWRLRFPMGTVSGGGGLFVAEAQMFDYGGSTDQCNGGAADASTSFNGSTLPANAFDNDTVFTAWQAEVADSVGSWLRYTFPTAVSVGQFTVKAGNTSSPKQIVLEYWDGASWVDVLTTGVLTWALNETKTFAV